MSVIISRVRQCHGELSSLLCSEIAGTSIKIPLGSCLGPKMTVAPLGNIEVELDNTFFGKYELEHIGQKQFLGFAYIAAFRRQEQVFRSEEHTSELQSRGHLVCRLLLETKQII